MTQTFVPTRRPQPMSGTALLGLQASDLVELGQAVRTGFKTSAVTTFAEHLNLTLAQTLSLLQLNDSTYHHQKRKQRPLGSQTSANLYHLARVTEAAEAYFEDKVTAHAWLQTVRPIFGHQTPLQFALIPTGAEYVMDVLARLEHGVYA